MNDPVQMHPDSTPSQPVTRLLVRAIPNARQIGIVGTVGDRLKVKVNAPAEDGKANRAICELLAQELGLKSRNLRIERGTTEQEKTLRLEGISVQEVKIRLGLPG